MGPSEPLALDEVDALGESVYTLHQHALESDHSGEYVAIHPASRDYTVARSTAAAMRELRKRQPERPLYLRKIGDTPEYGLAARLLAGN